MDEGSPPRRGQRRERTPPPDLTRLFEAIPPAAVEAEMSLLGAMLWDHRVIGDVVPVLRGGDDFFRPAHRVLYETMVELYDQVASLDLVQLNQRLVDKGLLDEVGGLDYLVQLAEGFSLEEKSDL